MNKCSMVLLLAFLASGAYAGTIPGFASPSEVQEIVMDSLTEWTQKADAVGACGGADCCPDTVANDQCTGAGAPVACCTGVGAGTCNLEACLSFAEEVRNNKPRWAREVATHLQFDGDWVCDSFPSLRNESVQQTCCTTISGTPLVDVARIASEIAGLRNSP